MSYTIENLRADIRAVVDYNWQSEERDYEECLHPDNANSTEGHIFLVLQRLGRFAGDGWAICPSCEQPRSRALATFEPGSVCPNCGHVEPIDTGD